MRQNLKKVFNETEISNLSDKMFKVIVIKMFTDQGIGMEEHSEIFRDKKYTKVSNRSHRAEE